MPFKEEAIRLGTHFITNKTILKCNDMFMLCKEK